MRALGHGRAAWGRRLGSAALALLATLAGLAVPGEELPKERVVDLGGGVKMSLVLIPPDTFTMGSTEADIKAILAKWPDTKEEWFAQEKPAHKVTLSKAFWMGKHEVTVGQFRRFVEAKGYKTDAEKGTRYKGAWVYPGQPLEEDASWRKPYFNQTYDHPVVCVSWNDARAFVDWLNATDKAKPAGATYRLPTEAEWEYAARGPKSLKFPWGDQWDAARANFAGKGTGFLWDDKEVDDGHLRTAPVGSFSPKGDSPFGLADMAGNVSEWCEDLYGAYAGEEQKDPTGPASGEARVVRGGSGGSRPRDCRSADRHGSHPERRENELGFRLVLVPGP
jgi:formylglycine-generating enzyme required for sulfatase activity